MCMLQVKFVILRLNQYSSQFDSELSLFPSFLYIEDKPNSGFDKTRQETTYFTFYTTHRKKGDYTEVIVVSYFHTEY